jgi:hypothetical protein
MPETTLIKIVVVGTRTLAVKHKANNVPVHIRVTLLDQVPVALTLREVVEAFLETAKGGHLKFEGFTHGERGVAVMVAVEEHGAMDTTIDPELGCTYIDLHFALGGRGFLNAIDQHLSDGIDKLTNRGLEFLGMSSFLLITTTGIKRMGKGLGARNNVHVYRVFSGETVYM